MHDAFAGMVLDGIAVYSGIDTAIENTMTAYAGQLAVLENRRVTREEVELVFFD